MVGKSIIMQNLQKAQIILLCSLLLISFSFAGTPSLSVAEGSDNPILPVQVRTGIYLISLHDVSPKENSYVADFWVWFGYPHKENLNLLKSREFSNAKSIESISSDKEDKNNEVWDVEKVKGTFVQDFDVSKFPYDRHELKLIIEDSLNESSNLIFVPDIKNSKANEAETIGWKISSMDLTVREHKYSTNFGNPASQGGSAYHQIVATITIERVARGVIIKLLMGVYIAIAVAIISFLMKPNSDDVFSARMGVLIGMIFTVMINLQSADSEIGQSYNTVVDKVHIVAFVYLFISIAITLFSRCLCEANKENLAFKIDRASIPILAMSFTVINIFMLS